MSTTRRIMVHVDRGITGVSRYHRRLLQRCIFPCINLRLPCDYGIREVVRWLEPEQRGEGALMFGLELLEILTTTGRIQKCLCFSDALSLEQKGSKFFRRHFHNKSLYFWGSVAVDVVGDICVPCLCQCNYYGLVLDWHKLKGNQWHRRNPALCLR